MIDIPILAKDALREGDTKKEYRFIVYQTDGETVDFTIDNDTLVYESVKFDERMCSDTNLKFGLCEGTSLEFQSFNIPNITGRRIQAFVDVSYGNNQTCTIPMGWFTVSETSRQASTGILKITAYNKLQSTYLDANAKTIIQETFANFETVKMMDIISVLLANYRIDEDVKQIIPAYRYSNVYANSTTNNHYAIIYGGDTGILGAGIWRDISSSLTSSSNIRFNAEVIVGVFDVSGDYPVKVRFDKSIDMDEVDQTLYNSIRTQVVKANFLAGADNIMKELAQMSFTWVNKTLTGIFPHVEVVFKDGTSKIYGKSMFDLGLADGTLDDLNKITLLDVAWIYTVTTGELQSQWVQGSGVYTSQGMDFKTETSIDYKWYYTQADWQNNNPEIRAAQMPLLPDGSTYGNIFRELGDSYEITNTTPADLVEVNIWEMADVTLRELQTAVFETQCRFGQLDRVSDLFKGVSLNHDRLFPAETLYPSDTLYPTATEEDGQAERANKSMYSKLWADEGNIRTFRNLSITYKGTEIDPDTGNVSEVDKEYTTVINANGTDDYTITNNWMFKNLVWDRSDIVDYADTMVSKMRDVTWFPFEMWCAGLPYVETGDELEINMGEETYISYVLRRTLKGIQNLQDEMINGTLDIF